MKNNVQNFIEVIKDKLLLFGVQLILSFFALGICSWNAVSLLRKLLLTDYDFEVYPWVSIFFHPMESNLAHYMFLSINLGLYGLFVYLIINKKNTELIRHLAQERGSYSYLILFGSVISLILIPFLSVSQRIVISFVIFLTPLFYLFDPGLLLRKKTFSILSWILLFLISLEPFLVFKGPVYLMNEYDDIYGVTYIKGEDVSNKEFLTYLSEHDIDVVLDVFIDLKSNMDERQGISNRAVDIARFYNEFKYKDIKPIQQVIISKIERNELSLEKISNLKEQSYVSYKGLVEKLKTVDIEKIKQFYFYNQLEYSHQNMTRGQINHIGHVLNPINEYALGKPMGEVYPQYDIGFTFILQRTMDFFGGLSIENYYKCYIYYVIYFLTFLLLLYFLFKDSVYIFGVFAFVAAAFFYQGYIALILAPGILPLIHFFDAIVLILLLLFFRKKSLLYLGLAILLTLANVIINRQFGLMLAGAFIVSIFLYIIENKQGKNRYLWLSTLFISVLLIFLSLHLAAIGPMGKTFSYFILGLFSWPANPVIIFLTICYLVVSYLFLFFLREERHYFKYIYLFIFIYTQGLFVYYYWSGLSNHLPTVIPFAGLQLFLMIYLAREIFFKENINVSKLLHNCARILSFVLIFVVLISIKHFYKQKKMFMDNFGDHKIYEWNYDRAHLVTTINPESINESISLISKYSGNENGIYIISRYDNILPFLSKKYSKMPFFEMHWHLFSPVESQEAVSTLSSRKPEYIFVDSNMDNYSIDPWAKIYNDIGTIQERTSRIGRYRELYNIFYAVKDEYELIEKGKLISVYKRTS